MTTFSLVETALCKIFQILLVHIGIDCISIPGFLFRSLNPSLYDTSISYTFTTHNYGEDYNAYSYNRNEDGKFYYISQLKCTVFDHLKEDTEYSGKIPRNIHLRQYNHRPTMFNYA